MQKSLSKTELSKSLIKIRITNILTHQGMAQQLGITRFMVAAYENGLRNPSLDTLVMISDVFHVSVDDLLKGM